MPKKLDISQNALRVVEESVGKLGKMKSFTRDELIKKYGINLPTTKELKAAKSKVPREKIEN